MKVVKVYGALRELLGQCRFEFDVVTPGQAIKALCVNFPQLERWLLDSERNGVGYRVTVGKQKVREEDVSPLLMPFGQKEVFSITPVITGAGRGTGFIVAGVALIALSTVTFGTSAAFAGAFSATGIGAGAAATATGSIALLKVGAYLTLSGVAQMLSPTPTFDTPGSGQSVQDVQRLQSFSFSGISNVAQQGGPVPVVLGRAYAGSVVISAGLDVEQ